MRPVHVAFLWHHHQPYYRDLKTGEFAMPWVRLHGAKDYYGLAALAEEFPDLRMTVNLVPSLLRQFDEYVTRQGEDRWLSVARRRAEDLSEQDRVFLVKYFFMAHPEHFLRANPRYHELWEKARFGRRASDRVQKEFTAQDVRDLQVWANLAWFHPVLVEREPLLANLRRKGRGYSEEEKQSMLDLQLDVLSRIVPLHKRLQDEGRIEVSTTPFFHPILPLLVSFESARVAMPDVRLPAVTWGGAADARVHVRRAVDDYKARFGRAPRGMWPSEGSVSPGIVPILAEHGIRWMATDEEVLEESLGQRLQRDGAKHVANPDLLYRPYRLESDRGPVSIVFRDHHLSDLLGFHYQREPAERAARDMVERLLEIGRRDSGDEPTLVPIVLDGENPWEHYPGNAVEFLRALFRRVTTTEGIVTVRLGDHLEVNPPKKRIARLHSGSWIHHNFQIWIGHDEDRRAWELVAQVRERVQQLPDGAAKDRAMESVLIAEGSDWYWWFGEEHSSALDREFDALFRRHLLNACEFAGLPPPPELFKPIKRATGGTSVYTQPVGMLKVRIDGMRSDFFEWQAAGQYSVARDRVVMEQSFHGAVTAVYFGFDAENLFFRIDVAGSARERIAPGTSLSIVFLHPKERRITATGLPDARSLEVRGEGDKLLTNSMTSVAVDEIVELSCPFSTLGFVAEEAVEFFVELSREGTLVERLPLSAPLTFTVPGKTFGLENWEA